MAPAMIPVIVPNYCAKKEKLFVCPGVKYSLLQSLYTNKPVVKNEEPNKSAVVIGIAFWRAKRVPIYSSLRRFNAYC
jgi:hypothetical protein